MKKSNTRISTNDSAMDGQTIKAKERRRKNRKGRGFHPKPEERLAEGLTRKELLEKYGPTVRIIAEKISLNVPPNIDIDDLVSVGLIGLMDAADKFDSSRGYQFKTYSEFRIRGAILDELRAMDWVPRSARDRMKQMERAYQTLLREKGEKPTDLEVSEKLNVTIEKYQKMKRELASIRTFSIEDLIYSTSSENETLLRSLDSSPENTSPDVEIDKAMARIRLHELLGEMPAREKLVLTLYYYRGLNNSEISEVMGLSPSRIGQLHTQAVIRLKKRILGHEQAEVKSIVNLFSLLLAS